MVRAPISDKALDNTWIILDIAIDLIIVFVFVLILIYVVGVWHEVNWKTNTYYILQFSNTFMADLCPVIHQC